MRTQQTEKQTKKSAKPIKAELFSMESGMAVVFEDKTITDKQRKEAAQSLLDNMPGIAKPGKKTGQMILKEIRERGH